MDQHGRFGQPIFELMMVSDNELNAEPTRFLRLCHAADAAIDGDDHGGARAGNLLQSFAVEAISFIQPMRNVKVCYSTQKVQTLPKNGSAGGTVDVIIAINDNSPFLPNGSQQAIGCFLHSGE